MANSKDTKKVVKETVKPANQSENKKPSKTEKSVPAGGLSPAKKKTIPKKKK